MNQFTARDVADRLAAVRERIESVQRTWTHAVDVIAVTKGFDATAVDAAVAAGCSVIGENYAQDLLSKRDAIEASGVGVQFIGQLQSNKVRQIADLVTLWGTLDRTSLVAEIAKRAPGADVLVQVNATGENGKGGCSPADVPSLIETARQADLVVRGLMTVGPTDAPPAGARPGFELVRGLVDVHGLDVCSMGMSGDIEVAVECGSTEIRVGSALFGARPER